MRKIEYFIVRFIMNLIKTLLEPKINWLDALIVITGSVFIPSRSNGNIWFMFAWIIYLVVFREFLLGFYKDNCLAGILTIKDKMWEKDKYGGWVRHFTGKSETALEQAYQQGREEHSDWVEKQLDASFLAGQEKGCADTIEEIKKAVEKAGDLSKFGSASGAMMKGSMLKYLDQLKDNKEK